MPCNKLLGCVSWHLAGVPLLSDARLSFATFAELHWTVKQERVTAPKHMTVPPSAAAPD